VRPELELDTQILKRHSSTTLFIRVHQAILDGAIWRPIPVRPSIGPEMGSPASIIEWVSSPRRTALRRRLLAWLVGLVVEQQHDTSHQAAHQRQHTQQIHHFKLR
jgi:hypothetical protein